jgi:dTDP-4-amino-4,6-dideoxygalactose transaminase
MATMRIPFNAPYATGAEHRYISEAIENRHLSGDGPFTKRCHAWFQAQLGTRALLTHSCTAALEMCALLADLQPGDEVILPSFTFVSTANAFALRGAVPVFVDIEPEMMNIDPALIEAAITPRTRAICVVHYAGVAAAMEEILAIAERHRLFVFEDAAQGVMATYHGRPLGTFANLGALSFHETKNVSCGEGGALLINDAKLADRADIIREKGTNRSAFFRGQVDKYTWVDIGSSFLPSDLSAAFLWAQLEKAREITEARRRHWDRYFEGFRDAEARGLLVRPKEAPDRVHNAHMFYLLARSLPHRTRILERTNALGIGAVFHYVPLHSSPAGRRLGRAATAMKVTDSISERLFRLPLWPHMPEHLADEVMDVVVTAAQEA